MSKCAMERSRRKTTMAHRILTDAEHDISLEHTSEVRYIDPKTGEYLAEKPPLSDSMWRQNLLRIIRNYRGRIPLLISLKMQIKQGKTLTDKQLEAATSFIVTSHGNLKNSALCPMTSLER